MFPLLTMETRAKPLEVRIFAGFARGASRSEMREAELSTDVDTDI